MKAISIRNVPDHIYDGLRIMAKNNRRSLQEQIKLIIEREVRLENGSFLTGAAQWRKRLRGRNMSDTVETVRMDRER